MLVHIIKRIYFIPLQPHTTSLRWESQTFLLVPPLLIVLHSQPEHNQVRDYPSLIKVMLVMLTTLRMIKKQGSFLGRN